MNRKVRSIFSQIKFFFGLNPQILKKDRKFIPDKYKSVVLISADFELALAICHSRKYINDKDRKDKAISFERNNIPQILELAEKFDIPITWATVGHLFLESCEKENNLNHPEIPEVPAYVGRYWDFEGGDWFKYDPCSNLEVNKGWYAPDLIRKISKSKVSHEIGCHTFSHIDCRDGICPPQLMAAELDACKKLAGDFGIKLTSFVHPGHTIGNLSTLAEAGFTNFRTDYRNVLGYPIRHKNGLWEFEQTAEFVYRKEWSINYHISRYKKIINRAIKSNTLCVLWFHPSFDSIVVDRILPEIFKYLNENKDKIWVTSHGTYANWLNEKF